VLASCSRSLRISSAVAAASYFRIVRSMRRLPSFAGPFERRDAIRLDLQNGHVPAAGRYRLLASAASASTARSTRRTVSTARA
jgi:hypothetical protein